MVDFPLIQALWMDPDLSNKKDDVGFLNQRVRLHNLLLGCQLFSSIICLRHIRSEVFGAVIGLPWKGLVGLCLLFYQFRNKVFKSVCVCQLLSQFQFFATPQTVAYHAPLSMEFSRQEYWNRLTFLSPGDLPDPGIEPWSLALQADSLPSELPGKPIKSRV